MKIEYFDIQANLHQKEFDKTKFEFIIKMCEQISHNDKVLWNKIWIYDDLNNLFAIIRTDNFKIDYIKDLQFTNPKIFSAYKNLSNADEYYKFVCAFWTATGFAIYRNSIDKYNDDLDIFKQKATIQKLNILRKLLSSNTKNNYESLESLNENNLNNDNLDTNDLLDELSKIENVNLDTDLFDLNIDDFYKNCTEFDVNLELEYSTNIWSKNIINNLFGIKFKPLKKQVILSRDVNFNNHYGWIDKNYNGFVSTFFEHYDFKNISNDIKKRLPILNDIEYFVLPIGFPICVVPTDCYSSLESNEIIVKNNDLYKL